MTTHPYCVTIPPCYVTISPYYVTIPLFFFYITIPQRTVGHGLCMECGILQYSPLHDNNSPLNDNYSPSCDIHASHMTTTLPPVMTIPAPHT